MASPIAARDPLLTVCAAIAVVALGGCGGSTKTVSAANSPTTAPAANTSSRAATGATAPSVPTTTTPTTGSSGGTPPASSTRTAPEPAFAEKEKGAGTGGGEGLAAAEAVVRAHGYTPQDPSEYHPTQTLRVLIGTGSHSNDGYDKQAFFFVDGRYIGTDSTQPSAQLSVAAQSDTEVVLAYTLYRPGNPLCCPGGGQAKVRFQLNDGHLQPLDPIPPVSSSTGASRQ